MKIGLGSQISGKSCLVPQPNLIPTQCLKHYQKYWSKEYFSFCRFGRDVKIVHFIGPLKPWHYTYNSETGNVYTPSRSQGYVPHERTFLQLWWDIYVTFVQPEMRVSEIVYCQIGINLVLVRIMCIRVDVCRVSLKEIAVSLALLMVVCVVPCKLSQCSASIDRIFESVCNNNK